MPPLAARRRPGKKKTKKNPRPEGGKLGEAAPHTPKNKKGDEGSFRAAEERSWGSLLPVHKRAKGREKKLPLPSFFPPFDRRIKARRKQTFSHKSTFFLLLRLPFSPPTPPPPPPPTNSLLPPRPCTPARCFFLDLSRALCERTGESGRAEDEPARRGGKRETSNRNRLFLRRLPCYPLPLGNAFASTLRPCACSFSSASDSLTTSSIVLAKGKG